MTQKLRIATTFAIRESNVEVTALWLSVGVSVRRHVMNTMRAED